MFERRTEYEGEHYLTTKTFGNCTYYLFFTIQDAKVWVSLSSGNKRKYALVFEEKEVKSTGGLKALLWAKETMLLFPDWYLGKAERSLTSEKRSAANRITMLCVKPVDNRRKIIYQRGLEPLGFKIYNITTVGLTFCKKIKT